MTAAISVTSPEDVLNDALVRIGYAPWVPNIFDGSRAGNAALLVYAQTRDAVLRQFDWGFAEVIAAAVASGGSAPAPWALEYTYPVACIKLRNIFNAAYLADKNNPVPVLYTVANAAAGKVIWTNATSATLIYTAQISDPTKWEPLFVETLVVALGKRLAVLLSAPDAEKVQMEEAKEIVPLAQATLG